MSRETFIAALDVLSGTPTKKAVKKRDCQLCGFDRSVGKYYLAPHESPNHGWHRVCSNCAEMVSRLGSDVQYYKYTQEYRDQCNPQKPQIDNPDCEHVWEKWSLVSEVDKRTDRIFDWMRCTSCHCYGKRFSLGQEEMTDLTMEIDLNCSR